MNILNFNIMYFIKKYDCNIPKKKDIFKWVNEVLKSNKNLFYINILIVEKNKIKYLNFKYKKRNYCTNTLTFVSPYINTYKKKFIYCDIVICNSFLEMESILYRKKLYFHWAHIIIHSCLHIIGYKHNIDYNGNDIMRKKEMKILYKLNLVN